MAFTQYDSVGGAPIAVNTAVQAGVKGASTALSNSWRTPDGSTGYDELRGTCAPDGAVVGAATFAAEILSTVSLSQMYGVGAVGGQLATTGSIVNPIAVYKNLNVPVKAGTDLQANVYMNGTDIATTCFVTVELRFVDTVSGQATIAYTRMGQATAINAGVAMQTSGGSTAAGDVSVPVGYKRLIKTGVGGASTSGVIGGTGGQVYLAFPKAPIPMYKIAQGAGGTLNTSNIASAPIDISDWSYPLSENQTLPAQVFMLYTDIGAYSAFITYILSPNA